MDWGLGGDTMMTLLAWDEGLYPPGMEAGMKESEGEEPRSGKKRLWESKCSTRIIRHRTRASVMPLVLFPLLAYKILE
jgi:hypothetical protein